MKIFSKIYQRYIALFLPLAAVLLGILIMGLQSPISVQAFMPIPLPQFFSGEYSYDGTDWYLLEAEETLSAKNQDLYLRGHFENRVYENSRVYFYSDHISSEIFINGELLHQDILLEIEQYGMKLQPSMCSREWNYFYFPEEVSEDAIVEIHLKNPHTFGNLNAYNVFLETLCCTPNEDDFLAKNLYASAQPFNIIGIIIGIVGVLLLCSALASVFLRSPMEMTVVQIGLLAVFVCGGFLLDTIDLSFQSDNHIVNTYGWQICIMYSAYLMGIMVKDLLEGKRKQAAICVAGISAAIDISLILLSFSRVVLMYDTLRFWVMLQWGSCPVLIVCCVAEMICGNKKNHAELFVFLGMFICILLDCMGIMSSIYSRCVMTKAAVLLFFLLKLTQFAKSIIVNSKASSRAHKLEKELEESRIALMISQIQPHFIFNVLGTIRGLCREDPEQAWRGLGDFSVYLRANMNALTNANSIPFERELAHVETYLRLEQMRLGEKLNVVYDIQEKDFQIPPLMLQPLVENAVKHGLFYKAEGGTVVIRSIRNAGNILLIVQDDGIGFEAAARENNFDQREHYGLTNVRSRVEKMLGGSLRIDSHPERGSTVTLEFPVDNNS